MDVSALTQIISTVGFPITMVGVMSYYVKYITDQNSARMDKLNADHKAEMDSVTEALNNNTLALQHLTDLMAYQQGEQNNVTGR